MLKTEPSEQTTIGATIIEFGWYTVAIVFGTLATILPPYLTGSVVVPDPFSFFSFVNDATERAGIFEYRIRQALFFAFGILIGWRSPRKWVVKCLATMAAFPIIAIVDMSMGSKEHNLFPIEFFFYGWVTLPALTGAGLVQLVMRRARQRPAESTHSR